MTNLEYVADRIVPTAKAYGCLVSLDTTTDAILVTRGDLAFAVTALYAMDHDISEVIDYVDRMAKELVRKAAA